MTAYGPQLGLIASASDDVVLWNAGQSKPAATFRPHSSTITSLRWTANDRALASGGRDGLVVLSEASGALFDTLRPASLPKGAELPAVLSVTWSPASRYLAVGAVDALIRIYDLQKRVQALELRGHRAGVCAVSWSPSEVHIASSSTAGEVLIHRVQGSVAIVCRALAAQSLPVLALHWSPFHAMKLASGADDGSVCLWDASSTAHATLQHAFNEHTAACCGLQWSAVNHHLLVSGGRDGEVHFYDVTKLLLVRSFRSSAPLSTLAFAYDGVHLVCGTATGELELYDLRSASDAPLWRVRAHSGPVTSISLQRGADPSRRAALTNAASTTCAPLRVEENSNRSTPLQPRAQPPPPTERTPRVPAAVEPGSADGPRAAYKDSDGAGEPGCCERAPPGRVASASGDAYYKTEAEVEAAVTSVSSWPPSRLAVEVNVNVENEEDVAHESTSKAVASLSTNGFGDGHASAGSHLPQRPEDDVGRSDPLAQPAPRNDSMARDGSGAIAAVESIPNRPRSPLISRTAPRSSYSRLLDAQPSPMRAQEHTTDEQQLAPPGPSPKSVVPSFSSEFAFASTPAAAAASSDSGAAGRAVVGNSLLTPAGVEAAPVEAHGTNSRRASIGSQSTYEQRLAAVTAFGSSTGLLHAAPPVPVPSSMATGSDGERGTACSSAALPGPWLEGWMLELRAALQEEMRGMHVDLIRELEAQRHEMRELFASARAEVATVQEENTRLREEVARLRAPLGAVGLARP